MTLFNWTPERNPPLADIDKRWDLIMGSQEHKPWRAQVVTKKKKVIELDYNNNLKHSNKKDTTCIGKNASVNLNVVGGAKD